MSTRFGLLAATVTVALSACAVADAAGDIRHSLDIPGCICRTHALQCVGGDTI